MPFWKMRSYPTRYLANPYSFDLKEVHDLENEVSQCRIDFLIENDKDKKYETLQDALDDGLIPCKYCMPDYFQKHHKNSSGRDKFDKLFRK